MSITNGEESSSRGRDVVDYSFEEIDEFMVDVEQHSERSSHSRSPMDEHDEYNDATLSDPDYVEEATESLDENSEDEYDKIVTRGRAKRKSTAVAAKKDKPKKTKSPSTRQNRTTRAASVRF